MPYLYLFKRLPTKDDELEKLAQNLGVSMFGTVVTHSGRSGLDTNEVQRRIGEALKHRRESLTWLLALVAALAALASAVAAVVSASGCRP